MDKIKNYRFGVREGNKFVKLEPWKKFPFLIVFISTFLTPEIGIGQYLIEGQVDTSSTFKIAHLDIINTWDYFDSINDQDVIKSTPINPDGTYQFTGYELPEEEGFYRIRYSENDLGFSINSLNRNYINFIFSNKDNIKVLNTSFISDNPRNRILLEYIGLNDIFIKQQNEPSSKLNAEMHISKHKKFCENEIRQNKYGLTNLYLLYSSTININENSSLFRKVHNELEAASLIPQYRNSLDKIIQIYDYNSLVNTNKWLKNIVIGSLAINVILFAFLLRKRKSSIKSSDALKSKLTKKEMEVLTMIKDNKTNKEIASELFVSESTVKTHINNIYRKLNVKSRQEAINRLKN